MVKAKANKIIHNDTAIVSTLTCLSGMVNYDLTVVGGRVYWKRYFPQFWGNWKLLSLQSVGVHLLEIKVHTNGQWTQQVSNIQAKYQIWNRTRSGSSVTMKSIKTTLQSELLNSNCDRCLARSCALFIFIMVTVFLFFNTFIKVKAEDDSTSEPEDILSKVNHLRLKTANSVAHFKFNKKRVRVISDVKDVPEENHGILYWMARDQRVQGKVIHVV